MSPDSDANPEPSGPEEVSVSIVPELQADVPTPDAWPTPAERPYRRYLRRILVAILGCLWLGLFSLTINQAPENRLGWLYYPGETTLSQFGAAMRAVDAFLALSPLAQRANFTSPESLREDREWCADILRETIDYLSNTPSPAGAADASVNQLRAHLAIVLGEIGNRDEMLEVLDHLRQSDRGFIRFTVWCRAVYADVPVIPPYGPLAEDDFSRLGGHWTQWLFEERVANLTGDQPRSDFLSQWRRDLIRKQAGNIALFTLLNWSIIAAGLTWLIMVVRRKVWLTPAAPAPAFPASFTGGLGLFFAGQVLGLAWVGIVWDTVDGDSPWIRHYAFLMGFPTMLLIGFCHLFQPVDWGLAGAGEGFRLAGAGLKGFSPIFLISSMPALILAGLGIEGHWTETWREGETGLPWPQWLGPLINMAIWAPLFEEIAYRWLLYGGLRRRMPVWPSLVISSLLFGLAHHYSLAGLLSVTLFGAMNCLLYERSGSWIPGVIVHSLTNLLIFSEENLCYT